MSEQKIAEAAGEKDSHSRHSQPRVDTGHRGVAGTLVLSDELDENVCLLCYLSDFSSQICRI